MKSIVHPPYGTTDTGAGAIPWWAFNYLRISFGLVGAGNDLCKMNGLKMLSFGHCDGKIQFDRNVGFAF